MKIPPGDLDYIGESFDLISSKVQSVFAGSELFPQPNENTPATICDAMLQLIDVLRRYEHDREGRVSKEGAPPPAALHELGDYGFELVTGQAEWASKLNLAAESRELEALALPLALWISQQGGILSTLPPVVNAFAMLANSLRAPAELADLFRLTQPLLDSVDPEMFGDSGDPGQLEPWRMLLLNRGIVATRSHDLRLMEQAFRLILKHIPTDALPFFQEGMDQMDALDYPEEVRDLMQQYFQRSSEKSIRLH